MISSQLFASAYATGYTATVRFLTCKGASAEEAEEVAQAAWARGWEAKAQLHNEHRVLQWINSIAFRKFCTEKGRLRRRADLGEIIDTCPWLTSSIARIDLHTQIMKCSRLDRSLLIHRFYGFTDAEIAKRHGLTELATRVRIHRSRKALRADAAERRSNSDGAREVA